MTDLRAYVPNVLSGFRIVVFPLLLYWAHHKMEKPFITAMFFVLLSDVLDGYLARKWRIESYFGAKIDSYGDLLTMIAGLYGVYTMRWELIQPYVFWVWIFLISYALFYVLAFVRYRTIPSFHLYSWKTVAVLFALYFFILFLYGIEPVSFVTVVIAGILANIEEIILVFILPKPRHNCKSLYHVLREGISPVPPLD